MQCCWDVKIRLIRAMRREGGPEQESGRVAGKDFIARTRKDKGRKGLGKCRELSFVRERGVASACE